MKARLIQGNEACAEGALAAGCKFFAGYPITPSTEIAEIMSERLPLAGGRFIQMEDEIAGMAAIIGASLTGTKTMTATSGPGYSLKQENIGFAALTEVPVVVINVQRVGPSTGMPTSPAQGDVMQSRWGSHGDRPTVTLSPGSVEETYYATIRAFNIAEELRVPVTLLLDEVIGHMRERAVLDPERIELADRPRPLNKEGYLPYDAGDGGVPPMASFGDGYRFHVTGLSHDRRGFPTNSPEVAGQLIERLMNKVKQREKDLEWYEESEVDDADVVVVSFGAPARSALGAVREARQRGIKAGLLRLVTLWPFPEDRVREIASRAEHLVVAEMNMGQMILEVERVAAGRAGIHGVNRADGRLITPQQILDRVMEVANCG